MLNKPILHHFPTFTDIPLLTTPNPPYLTPRHTHHVRLSANPPNLTQLLTPHRILHQ